ncbi:hypothetical protein ACQ4PT_021567 [Festuca glaucescens]
MAFALKASPASPSSSAASRHSAGRRSAVTVAASRRLLVVRAAIHPAVPMGRLLLRAPCKRALTLTVAQTLSRVKEQGKTALIPYITAGDPDLATTAEALRLLDSLGADVIELGMPSPDPSADGPVIKASAQRALAAGATTDAVMAMLKEVTPDLSCPVVLFSYFDPIVRRGTASFAATAKDAGVKETIKNSLELILLTTPATTAEKIREITKAFQGFVYLVSVVGITGACATVNPHVKDLLKEIRKVSDKAVAVGFGISTPEHVSQIVEWGADGVIIGSAMVKQLGEAQSPTQGLKRLEVYARSLKDALPC